MCDDLFAEENLNAFGLFVLVPVLMWPVLPVCRFIGIVYTKGVKDRQVSKEIADTERYIHERARVGGREGDK